MKMKRFATTVATVLAGAFALAACTTPDATPQAPVTPAATAPAEGGETVTGDDVLTPVEGGTVTLGMTNTPNALIDVWPNAANSTILYLTQGPGFAFFDDDLNYVRNTDFGTFDLIEQTDETMTVRYTINEGVQWSDGTPVDAADMILWWAANNDRFDPEAIGDDVFIPGSVSQTTVTDFPQISDDGRTITFTYNNVRSDWYFQFGVSSVPAHIVARRALGIQDPMEAKQALITALGGPENYREQDGTEVPTVQTQINTHAVDTNDNPIDMTITTFVAPDVAAIRAIAEVYNNDWTFTPGFPSDPDLTISAGPFILAELVDGEFIRLERNPNFTAHGSVVGVPNVDEIIVRFISDPMAMVMALQNGEVDIIAPQTSVDTIAALQGIPDVSYIATVDSVYEHVTLVFNNGGPFDPAHWGGNEDTARAVRLAFLHTLPREQIIELLVRPLDPNLQVRNAWTQIPGAPAYPAITAGNNSALFANQDLEQARQLLIDAGLEDQLPINVRLLSAAGNTRRENQVELIMAAAPDLFNVINNAAPDWGTILRAGDGSFDAGLWGWGSTSTAWNNAESNFITGGTNAIGGFSNPRVDEIWSEITRTFDEDRIVELVTEAEQILFDEGYGLPIFQWPGVLAWRDRVLNVVPMPLGAQEVWNFWDWQIVE